jgi:hypothetical protein
MVAKLNQIIAIDKWGHYNLYSPDGLRQGCFDFSALCRDRRH